MEIEPERMNPSDQRASTPFKKPKKWQLYLFGAVALIIGVALLFFMFWAALFFMALGILTLIFQRIRSWFTGKPPAGSSQSGVKVYINRGPPRS
ncbi:hypothetical protein P0Y35_10570 [Kiritimatiellaeota bacterium B1221]|nr:hypothetical protein [Kiritimatiellaeota bacterium B1221]